MKTILRIGIVFVLLCFFVNPIQAQEEEKPYWGITQYKIDRSKIDSLKVLEEKYYSKIVEQAKKMGLVEDTLLLIMKIGGDEYNVIEINKCSTWNKVNFSWSEPFELVEPDKKKREEANAAYQWIFEGSKRKSAIYEAAAEFYH